MTITINTLARPLDPEVLKLEQAVNAFGQDYIPAILSFITPAKLSGLDYAPYRKDGNYADDQLGLPGNFIIEPIPDLRSKGKRIKWCNLLYSHDDNCVDLKKIGSYYDVLTTALVSLCCGTRTSKLFYLGRQVHHNVPYLWDYARQNKTSIFDPYFIYECMYLKGISLWHTNDIRRVFLKLWQIEGIVEEVQRFPPKVVAGVANIKNYAQKNFFKEGFGVQIQDSDWMSILKKYHSYTKDCVPKDKEGNDAVQQAWQCYRYIIDRLR